MVYLTVTGNEGGGYFSREPIPLDTIQTVLATPLATGDPFATSLLRRAFVNKSNNNGCFLAAILRHAGLLKAAEPPHLHVCAGDWPVWADNQRHRLTKAQALEATKPVEAPTGTDVADAATPTAQPSAPLAGDVTGADGTAGQPEQPTDEVSPSGGKGAARGPRQDKGGRGAGGNRHADA